MGQGHGGAINTGLLPDDRAKTSRALGVTTLAIDPSQSGTVYTGTLNGLYKTNDGGRTWIRIGKELPDQFIAAIVLNPSHPEMLYVASRAGVFQTGNGGLVWEARNRGLGNRNVLSLAIGPGAPPPLYAGTNGHGLFRSRDGAASWEPVVIELE